MSKKKEPELEGKGGGNCVVWKRIGNLDLEFYLHSVERQCWNNSTRIIKGI